MKKWIAVLAAVTIFTGCGSISATTDSPTSAAESTSHSSLIQTESSAFSAESEVSSTSQPPQDAYSTFSIPIDSTDSTLHTISVPSNTPKSASVPTVAPTEAPSPLPEPTAAPTPVPTVQPTPEPTSKPVNLAYGAVPFNLAAGTDEWWGIDSTDSAYQACADNINAIRGEKGLPALSLNESLSAAADARCESFVAGRPFDHTGMTTLSEICAQGPLRSAQEVCTAWKGSTAHYNNIMRTDISQMGVGCWFCSTSQGDYTYWVVTFG